MPGGGSGTAKNQLNLQNQLQQQALQQQTALQNQVMGGVGKYLSGNVGYDPAMLASMTSQFLNNNTSNFNQAGQAVMSQLASRGAAGGSMPVGGDFTRGLEALQGARASSQSQGLLGLNVQNAQQALNNQFNAASIASGLSGQQGQNIGTFGSGANNSLNQYVASQQNSFLGQLGKGFGSALGGGLGAIATGGIGASLGGISQFLKGSGSGITAVPGSPGYFTGGGVDPGFNYGAPS